MTEKRQDLRLSLEDIVCFLELQSASIDSGRRQEIICSISDVSANGLRLDLDRLLEKDAIHTLRIKLPSKEDTLMIIGEVAWSRESEEFGHQAGIVLFESDDSDIAHWKNSIADLI